MCKKLLLISLIVHSFLTLSAQDIKVIRDFRFINELGINKKLSKQWEVGFENLVKLEKNSSKIDEIDFDLFINYKPFNLLSLGSGYRMALNHKKNGSYEKKHQLNAEIELNATIKHLCFEYRLRYQNIDDDFLLYEEPYPSKNILRNRIQFKYNIPRCRLTPYTDIELYGKIHSKDKFAMKIKFSIGTKYSLGKYGKLKAYYRIDRELNDEHPYTYFNLGFGYVYEF